MKLLFQYSWEIFSRLSSAASTLCMRSKKIMTNSTTARIFLGTKSLVGLVKLSVEHRNVLPLSS